LATKKSTSTSGKDASKTKAKATPTAKTEEAVAAEVEASLTDQAAEEPESDCKHAWLIDPPNGPTSDGACTVCGMKREFRNSYEYTPSWTARSGKAGAAKAAAAKNAASAKAAAAAAAKNAK
jgi:hypothetical protein